MRKVHRLAALLAVWPLPQAAFAQLVPPAPAPLPAPDSNAGATHPQAPARKPAAPQAEQVVVTGTRIVRPDYQSPNPVVSLNAATIQQSGETNITTFLQRVPALTNSLDPTRTAGNAQTTGEVGQIGLDLLDLRGLGPQRTLVLVDGRRHVAGQVDTAAVDVSAIPIDLIQRVDVLTGAVSAVYGADGVSGVVNFILKRDFEGVAARSQIGISEHGDASNRFVSVMSGHNFDGGRGNFTLAYEHNEDDPLANDDRSELRQANRQYFVNLDNYSPGTPGSYKIGPLGDLRYPQGSNLGYVPVGDQIFRGDGQIYVPGRLLQNDSYSVGGDDTPVAGYIGDILPRTRRDAVNLLTHYDWSDAFKVSLEAKYVSNDATSFAGYSGDYPATIALDNPFIPASILAATRAAGLSSVDISRNNFDLPRQGEDDLRQTYRTVLDVSGRINDDLNYDAYYEYGQTDLRATKINDRLNDRFTAALDVVRNPANGQPVCRSSLDPTAVSTPSVTFTPGPSSGCIPVNLFGGNTVNPASFAFYLNNPVSNARITQNVVNGSVTGNFGHFLPLPGGPINFAVGAEYRRESSSFAPASALTNNLFYQYDEYVIPTASSGQFDVGEVFGEIDAPILKDVPFAKLLSVGAAGRYSDYSTVGSTRTYELNATWQPARPVLFRGTFGHAVRAPNIGELYQPQTGTSNFFADPCYVANRELGTQYRTANCQALIAQNGGDFANFTAANNPNANIFIPGLQQGNPNLRAEAARTWTVGVVLRPEIIPGLSLGLDWYDIRIRDAINTPDANTLANLCVDQPTLDNQYCATIDRQPGTGFIDGYIVQPQNVAEFRTAGAELNATYRFLTARDGLFDLRLVGGYLNRLEQVASPGAVPENNVDQIYRPEFTATFSPTWVFGPVTVAYTLRWQDAVRRFARIETDSDPTLVDPRYFRHSALYENDIQTQVAINDHVAVDVGINNLTDQKPDNGFETDVPISPVGRFFYIGARFH